jgi:hypothetical protein
MNQHEEQRSPFPGVAAKVRDFYERYPYPRPIDDQVVFDASRCGTGREEI